MSDVEAPLDPELQHNLRIAQADQPRFAASLMADEPYAPGPDAQVQSGVPQGLLTQHDWLSKHV